MKRFVFPILFATLCILLALFVSNPHSAKQETPIGNYVSILKGDCYLCGNGSVTETSCFWGEDNVGIINLNTFDVLRLEINRYNSQGHHLGAAGYMQSCHLSSENSHVHAYIFPDNGFASVQISGVQYKVDRASIETNLCQRCIDSINVVDGTAILEYAIVNFYDRTIHPLSNCQTYYNLGNYAIQCIFQDNNSIKLVVCCSSTQNS